MSIVKINNEIRAKFGKSIKSKEQLMKIESKYIRIANFINKIENSIVNNKFSNWLKELFTVGFDYPLYMYSDEGNFYVMNISDGKLDTGESYSDISVCQDTKYAMDFRKVFKITRWFLLKKATKILAERQRADGDNMEYTFRYKSFMNIKADLEDAPNMILRP